MRTQDRIPGDVRQSGCPPRSGGALAWMLLAALLSPSSAHAYRISQFGACFGASDDSVAVQAAVNAALSSADHTITFDCLAPMARGVVAQRRTGQAAIRLEASRPGFGIRAVGIPVDPVYAIGSLGSALLVIRNCNDCLVSGLTFDGNSTGVIMLGVQSSWRPTVTASVVKNVGPRGVRSVGAALSAVGNHDGTYSQNTIQNTGLDRNGMTVGQYGDAGKELEYNPTVQYNTISDIGGNGITIVSQGGLFSANHVRGSFRSGIILSGYQGLVANGVTLEGNDVSRSGGHGIQSDMYPGEFTLNITLRNNAVYENNGSGIYAVRTDGWTIEGNRARDNDFDRAVGANSSGQGITVQSSRNLIIRNNTLKNSHRTRLTQDYGITLAPYGGNSAAPDIYNVTITGNTVTWHTSDGIGVAPGGYLDLVSMTGNTSSSNARCGIMVVESQNMSCSVTRASQSGNVLTKNAQGSYCDVRTSIPGCPR